MKFTLILLIALIMACSPTASLGGSGGVILVYHHVSESTPDSTSVSPETFKSHLQYLRENHTVISLWSLVEGLRSNQQLPDKAVAITFDDGYKNIFTNAHPLLSQYNFPYTVFINPPMIGQRSDQLSWQQIKEMHQMGATFANHTMNHSHLLARSNSQNDTQWRGWVRQEIQQAQQMLSQRLGSEVPKWIAYPFGEYSQALQQLVSHMGYIGFGQHSGAVAPYSDFTALPRFAVAGAYANLETMKVKLNSRAMPIIGLSQRDPLVTMRPALPRQTLTLDTTDLNIANINCFLNGAVMKIDRQESGIVLAPEKPLKAGRTRINCTAPSKQHKGQYYWYSQPWFVATEDGEWLD